MDLVLLLILSVAYITLSGALTGATTQEEFCGYEKQSAGYIHLPNRIDSHYFYWYFESRNEPSSDPLLVWLPGGPGLSGTFGLLAENGPCAIDDDLSTRPNPYSWTTAANMVWIDLPVNSGFSFSTVEEDDEFTDERVAESVFWFLQGFFKKHSNLQGREIFLIGESYGGHFAPVVAHHIWTKQSEHLFCFASTDNVPINLQGIFIGNGLTDPIEIDTHFADMSENPFNIKLLTDTKLASMKAAVPECRNLMVKCQTNTSICGEAGEYCMRTQLLPILESHRSPYDIRQQCSISLSNMTACLRKGPIVKAYLDLPKVREFLGIHPALGEWTLLNHTINGGFFGAPSYSGCKSTSDKVSDLLEAGLQVLFYAGDADLLCNVYAIEKTVEKLNWFGSSGFIATKSRAYTTTTGIEAGTVRSFSKLTYVKVHNAGHMVPADQPEVALDIILKFIREKPF
ncbi:Serine protease [Phytophthora megakarya]|uniref:Carboxypeptidase n=1 Tax=Phytophthora megakarya TaxID=4795 RepID=A0A225V530_9STRA|nr:Serine protease [Phytophthora megakarya]